MLHLKVRKVGNSLGFVLPREAADRMHVQEGDTLYLTEAPDGGYKITPYGPGTDLLMGLVAAKSARC